MNLFQRLLLPLLLSLLFIGSPQFIEWYTLESDDKSYKIQFPSKPESLPQQIPTEIGTLDLQIYVAEMSSPGTDDNMAYMFGLTTYPEGTAHSDSIATLDEFFRGSVDGAVRNMNGTLLSEKKIEYEGYPGREIEVDFQNGLAVSKMKTFLVGRTLYMLQTMTATDKYENPSITRFMNSFVLDVNQN